MERNVRRLKMLVGHLPRSTRGYTRWEWERRAWKVLHTAQTMEYHNQITHPRDFRPKTRSARAACRENRSLTIAIADELCVELLREET